VTEPEALVRRYWDEVWAQGRLEVIDELFAEPYIRHNRNGNQAVSLEQLKKGMVQYWRTLRDPKPTIEDLAVAGDRVWTRLSISGFDSESERQFVVSWLQVFRVEDGRLAEAWTMTLPDVDWSKPPKKP
jgi:predicted SnoaL-like aldol condensation-catalyzing enzyme